MSDRLSETLPEFLGRADADEPFHVIIVGSGYGGSIAAHSIAAAAETNPEKNENLRVLLLERGKEFKPGDFPSSFGELPRELRLARQDSGTVSGHEGLFDVRLGSDVVAMVANGLGGGSLINAGVMLEPEPGDIEHNEAAPGTHRKALVDHLHLLKKAKIFTRASRLLGGQVKRNDMWVHNDGTRLTQPLRKAQAFEALASARGKTMQPLEITVNFDGQRNLAGTPLSACNQCGDCMTGCNVGAKDSLDKSLLAWAKKRLGDRLTIVTGATVGSLVPESKAGSAPSWKLRVYHTSAALQARETGAPVASPHGNLLLRGERVVLAAGTLGSPEILLRSRTDQLVLSPRLGESFSGNGDDIAAVHRLPQPVHGGADERVPLDQRCVGPTTTARVTLRGGYRPFQVEEFAVPGPVKRLFDETVTTGWAIARLPHADDETHREGDADPMAVDPDAMQKTLLVGVVGHDSADGSLQLAQPLRPRDAAPQMGALRIHWPQARHGKEFDDAHKTLRQFVQGNSQSSLQQEPVLVANPMWRLLPAGLEELVTQPRGPVLTVHPLGGCRIATDMNEGVVDALGRVFDARSANSEEVFDSLVVLDGSIIGSSLGVNPALTISALALHAMDRHVEAWGIGKATQDPETNPDQDARPGHEHKAPPSPCQPAPETPAPSPSRTWVSVTERLWGAVSLRGTTPRHVLELTLAFGAQPVSTLISPDRQPMPVLPQESRLRLYTAEDWQRHHLKAATDGERQNFVQFEARLGGSLRFLQRAPSSPCERKRRGLWAWLRNRGMRDLWQRMFAPRLHGEPKPKTNLAKAREFANLASHNGQRRLFDYQLHIGELLRSQGDLHLLLRPGAKIEGSKQLGYARRASPWTQLTEMQLTQMPGLARAATLKLDPRFLAQQGKPLLHIEKQHDHAEALAELMSFGLYMFRVLLATHLWSFRRPDAQSDDGAHREVYRLPADIPGLPSPEITTLVVDRWRADDDAPYEPVTIRLTRYARPGQDGQPTGKPLVMLHGYSASGTTFAHPSLKGHGAAAFFCHQGRDVWVVDLRTSCGLPSAVLPWAMEQPALVDIPAALVHIRNVTGQKVDVLAHCIGGAMLGMAVLSDAESVRSSALQLGTDSWLTNEHFGTLTAFNGPAFKGLGNDGSAMDGLAVHGSAPDGTPGAAPAHPTIDRIVLSQKGPVLRYTDANLLRAYVLQFLRRWLLPPNFSFQPSRDPGVAEQLLDRFLSSLPYPAWDFDTENPMRPCARTEWVASRHRLDALFGRVFSANNLRPQTLASINDLFGPINLDTVAQTIHFARYDAITNQRGRGEFVTRERLRSRWGGIRTMVLHGEDNGLVDPFTKELLHQQLGAAGVPVVALPLLRHVGHQDSLIGTSSHLVFKEVESFLSDPLPVPSQPQHAVPALVCAAPWLGPRLAPPLAGGRPLRVAAMSRPDQGRAALWLFAAQRQALSDGSWVYALLDPQRAAVKGETGSSLGWCFATPEAQPEGLPEGLPDDLAVGPAAAAAQRGWLAVFVYAVEQTTAQAWPGSATAVASAAVLAPDAVAARKAPDGANALQSPPPARPAPLPVQPIVIRNEQFPFSHKSPLLSNAALQRLGAVQWIKPMSLPKPLKAPVPEDLPPLAEKDTTPADVVAAVQSWVDLTQPEALGQCFLAANDLSRAAVLHGPAVGPKGLRFALASCQYPSGLFDRIPAQASLLALTEHSLPEQPLDMALLVGDQIYADATAGLVDPTREDELYELPHQRALRHSGLRAVMRRMPVNMLLDDHELFDNWQPLPTALPDRLRRVHQERRRIQKTRHNGMHAYLHYQRMLRVDSGAALPPADFQFQAAGHPFYMLDTRSGRRRGTPSAGSAEGLIISPERMQHLKHWLSKHPDAVKFVASASMLLPRRSDVVGRPRNACRADGWDGFPESLADLLQFIEAKRIRHTVFLSGDAHHSLHVQAWLGPQRIKVVSVHSSALYAPYPFANGQPRELQLHETSHDLGVGLETHTTLADAGDGFAVLEVAGTAAAPALQIQYLKADGSAGAVKWVALDGPPA